MPRKFALWIVMIIAVVSGTSAVLAQAGAIRLLSGDRITVTVYGQPDLSGVFQVDAQGNIELPLVGAISVGDLTLNECEKLLEARLEEGYIRHPAVNVRVSEVRPIYVLGDVKTPGAIAFRHGTNVLGVIAQAGGFGGGDPLLVATALADFLIADERVRTLETTRRLLLLRKARLEAQRDGKTSFEVPGHAAIEADKQLVAAIQNEHDSLSAQLDALEKEVELQRKQKPRLELAYSAIEKQIEAEKMQFDLVQSQLNDVARLQTLGLARRTTEVALQREHAALDSNMSRYRSELARLAVTVGEIDIKIQDTQNAYIRRILAELQDVRSKLQEIDIALPSAREVREVRSEQAGNSGPSFDSQRTSHRIVVNRTINNRLRALNVTEEALLEPGDIVEVKRLRARSTATGLGTTGALDQTLRNNFASDSTATRQRPE
jgi:polysaccharide export outer membrane protein